MLFGYPAEANAENWFHDCLVEMLQNIHANPNQTPAWPDIIPGSFREILRARNGLRDRLINYQDAISRLNPEELVQVSQALLDQNRIAELLACQCNCLNLDQLPQTIREPLRSLSRFGFELLTPLGLRDLQYRIIYDSNQHLCPFCGCEYFDAPGAPREALDHYLADSKYPFAAANLHNLVPMGNKCNSKYKLAEDILYNEDGTRRRSYNPYNNNQGIHISLDRSDPFSGDEGVFSPSSWEIDFEPNVEEVTTWNDVFHIRDRYIRDVLDVEIKNWLWIFGAWCRSAQVRATCMTDVIDALQRYANLMEVTGIHDRAFLKAAVFRMLYFKCQQNNQRMIGILSGLVFGVSS